jgi:hypothetical protein
MKDLLFALLHVAVMTAKLCRPGGVRGDRGESPAQAATDRPSCLLRKCADVSPRTFCTFSPELSSRRRTIPMDRAAEIHQALLHRH